MSLSRGIPAPHFPPSSVPAQVAALLEVARDWGGAGAGAGPELTQAPMRGRPRSVLLPRDDDVDDDHDGGGWRGRRGLESTQEPAER